MADNFWECAPVIERYGNMTVVREDLVPGGAKMRFLPYLVQGAKEIVFGGPFCGGAPYALSIYGARMGVKITLFYAKRKDLHPRQKAALRNGATIYQVPFGYMTNVQAKAKAYAAANGALFLPLGFDVPQASAPFIAHMRKVRALVGHVDQVWCATGSGMLARCLGEAFPDLPIFGVRVGLASRNSKQHFSSNVTLLKSAYDFAETTKATAPFPSCGNYDRKAYELAVKHGKGKILFWNVLG